jgi:hypothetical protein
MKSKKKAGPFGPALGFMLFVASARITNFQGNEI